MDRMNLATGRFDPVNPLDTISGEGEREFTPKPVTIKADHMQLAIHKREYGRDGKRWSPVKLPVGKSQIRIGTSQTECEIVVREPGVDQCQTLLLPVNDAWMIIECGKSMLMKVNGIQRRQARVHVGGTAHLEIGSTAFLIQNLGDKTAPPADEPTLKSYTVTTPSGEKRVLYNRPILIGEDSSCAIAVKGDPFYGLLASYEGMPYVYSFGGEKIKVDGIPVLAMCPLENKTTLTVDIVEMQITLPSPDAPDKAGAGIIPPKVDMGLGLWYIDENGEIAERFELPGPGASLFIGRGADCNLKIDGTTISRKHAQVVMYDSSIMLLDCYSTNGTYVNGVKIAKKTVHPGDIFQLGNLAFILVYADQ